MLANLSTIDAAIIVIYLAAMISFGVWIGRGQKNISDFLLGDRSLHWMVVLLSIVATETSTATFLSVPGLAYVSNMAFLQLAIGYILGRYVVALVLLPQYFQGTLFTAYEVLNRRFGTGTKRAASLLFIVMRNMSDGLRLLLAAIVLKKLLFPQAPALAGEYDPHLAWAIVIMGSVTIVYTMIGGMKAVAWTDVIQFFIYILGAVFTLVVVIQRVPGGWSEIMSFAQASDKLRVLNPVLDFEQPYTIWAGVVGGIFITLTSHGTDQLMVQRYLSAKSQQEAARALRWSGWVVLAQFSLFLLLGVALACFYAGRSFATGDDVFATFIVEELPVGIKGLTVAAVFAAAMSTLSSSLNSSAAAAVNDFYLPMLKRDVSPAFALRVTRIATFAFGLIQIAVGIAGQFANGPGSNIINSVMAIATFTMGIVLGLFMLGTLTQRVGQTASLIALVLGLAGMTTVYFKTTLAWPWYPVVGSAGTFAIGLFASYVVRERPAKRAQ